jgi:hypothetical protein
MKTKLIKLFRFIVLLVLAIIGGAFIIFMFGSCNQEAKQIFKPIPFGNLQIGETDGTATLWNVRDDSVFHGYDNRHPEEIDYRSGLTPETMVQAYERTGAKGNVLEAFKQISSDLNELVLTQNQIVKFCQEHPDWLWQVDNFVSNDNFFLTKDSLTHEYFVVTIECDTWHKNFGELNVGFCRFPDLYHNTDYNLAECNHPRLFVRDDRCVLKVPADKLMKSMSTDQWFFVPYSDATRRIADSKEIFDGGIDFSELYGYEFQLSDPVPFRDEWIDIYKVNRDFLVENDRERFNQIFGSFSVCPDYLSLTQSQFVNLCEKYRSVIAYNSSYLFLMKDENNYFVANMCMTELGRLKVEVVRLDGCGCISDEQNIYVGLPRLGAKHRTFPVQCF